MLSCSREPRLSITARRRSTEISFTPSAISSLTR
jgi:hypothetical protein